MERQVTIPEILEVLKDKISTHQMIADTYSPERFKHTKKYYDSRLYTDFLFHDDMIGRLKTVCGHLKYVHKKESERWRTGERKV